MDDISFTIDGGAPSAAPLSKAILIYSRGDHAKATVHDVAEVDGAPTILQGCAVTADAVHRLARALDGGDDDCGFLPAPLLWRSRGRMLWWLPPGRRQMIFRVDAWQHERRAIVPHPGLLFYAAADRWMVWAVKGSARPDLDTRVWRAPYMNVFDTRNICPGTTELPPNRDNTALEAWNRAFFGSAFSHFASADVLRYKDGGGAFWLAMLAGRFRRFPEWVLVPSAAATLGGLIDHLARGLNGHAD